MTFSVVGIACSNMSNDCTPEMIRSNIKYEVIAQGFNMYSVQKFYI